MQVGGRAHERAVVVGGDLDVAVARHPADVGPVPQRVVDGPRVGEPGPRSVAERHLVRKDGPAVPGRRADVARRVDRPQLEGVLPVLDARVLVRALAGRPLAAVEPARERHPRLVVGEREDAAMGGRELAGTGVDHGNGRRRRVDRPFVRDDGALVARGVAGLDLEPVPALAQPGVLDRALARAERRAVEPARVRDAGFRAREREARRRGGCRIVRRLVEHRRRRTGGVDHQHAGRDAAVVGLVALAHAAEGVRAGLEAICAVGNRRRDLDALGAWRRRAPAQPADEPAADRDPRAGAHQPVAGPRRARGSPSVVGNDVGDGERLAGDGERGRVAERADGQVGASGVRHGDRGGRCGEQDHGEGREPPGSAS